MKVELTHVRSRFICLFDKKLFLPAVFEVVAMATQSFTVSR